MVDEHTAEVLLLPQLMAQAFAKLIDDLHEHLVRAGYTDLRATHCLNVFRFMDCNGTRPTVLARRAGMTPQAMGELVSYLERGGYVRRVPAPSDRRGRVVVYADRGIQAAQVAMEFFADQETIWSTAIGRDRLEAVKSDLRRILAERPQAGRGTSDNRA